ncbi:MAG TPA: amidohydrolase family protein [Bacteroidota bacterium]
MSGKPILLQNARYFANGKFQKADIRISGSTIAEICDQIQPSKNDFVVSVEDNFVFPGLINSHDHLEFNLFSRLGDPPYQNYVEWSTDIHRSSREEILKITSIPLKYRLLWGAYKNLFSGVTTVVHHNRYSWRFRWRYPVEVFKDYDWIHSLQLEKRDLKKLLTSTKALRFIHLAEGIDEGSSKEFTALRKLGGLTKNTVIIHGVGLTDQDIEVMGQVAAGFVWCPSSNLFLFGRTANIEKILGRMPVVLGTDSTLTGSFTMFDELRTAHRLVSLEMNEIVGLVTSAPADLLHMNKGRIQENASADLLVVNATHSDPFNVLLNLTPKGITCLMKNGVPIFGDSQFAEGLRKHGRTYSTISVGDREKFVIGDFHGLVRNIRRYSPGLLLPQAYFS